MTTSTPGLAEQHALAEASGPPRLAPLGNRFLATIIDSSIVVSLLYPIGMVIAIRNGMLTENGFKLEGLPALTWMAFAAFVWFVYYWISEGLYGATVGKSLLSIQVQQTKGDEFGLGSSFVRNLFRFVDVVGLYFVGGLVAMVSSKKQRIGDLAGHTIVVETQNTPRQRGIAAACWIATMVVSIVAGSVIRHFL